MKLHDFNRCLFLRANGYLRQAIPFSADQEDLESDYLPQSSHLAAKWNA